MSSAIAQPTGVRDAVEALLADADPDGSELQWLLATAVRRYADRRQRGEALVPFPASGEGHAPTPTEVSIATSSMLGQLEIEIFELALWRSWGGGA